MSNRFNQQTKVQLLILYCLVINQHNKRRSKLLKRIFFSICLLIILIAYGYTVRYLQTQIEIKDNELSVLSSEINLLTAKLIKMEPPITEEELKKLNERNKYLINRNGELKESNERYMSYNSTLLDENEGLAEKLDQSKIRQIQLAMNLYDVSMYYNKDILINNISTSMDYESFKALIQNDSKLNISVFPNDFKYGEYMIIDGDINIDINNMSFNLGSLNPDEVTDMSYRYLMPLQNATTDVTGDFVLSKQLAVKFIERDKEGTGKTVMMLFKAD